VNRDDVFMVWAPPHAPWSSWVKPILFAYVRGRAGEPTDMQLPPPPDWTPPANGETAFVLDLSGPEGVWLALALAATGYRPVPLYNACPSPVVSSTVPATTVEMPNPQLVMTSSVAVDVWAIIDAIEDATWPLAKRALPIDAPPAFLLDASRRVGSGPYAPTPGSFDNRSISLPTDFPSGTLLLSRGIRRIILVQQNTLDPQEDLTHTLLRWQQAGLRIEAVALHGAPQPTAITVAKPSLFRRAWYRTLATFKFIRNPLGGFGGRVPEPSSSGGAG
jgi:hypothetical protein